MYNISSQKASVCRPTKVQPIPSSGQRLWKKMQLNQRVSHPMQIKHTPKTLDQEKRRVPSAEPEILCSSALNMVNICQKVRPALLITQTHKQKPPVSGHHNHHLVYFLHSNTIQDDENVMEYWFLRPTKVWASHLANDRDVQVCKVGNNLNLCLSFLPGLPCCTLCSRFPKLHVTSWQCPATSMWTITSLTWEQYYAV